MILQNLLSCVPKLQEWRTFTSCTILGFSKGALFQKPKGELPYSPGWRVRLAEDFEVTLS